MNGENIMCTLAGLPSLAVQAILLFNHIGPGVFPPLCIFLYLYPYTIFNLILILLHYLNRIECQGQRQRFDYWMAFDKTFKQQ